MKLNAPHLYASPSPSPSKGSNTQREGVTVFKEVAHIPKETWEEAIRSIVKTYDEEFIIKVPNNFSRSRRDDKSIYRFTPEIPHLPFRFRILEKKGKTGPNVNSYQLLAYPRDMLDDPLSILFEEMERIEKNIIQYLRDKLSIDAEKIRHTPTTLDTLFTTMTYSTEDPYNPYEWQF
jgi:hypothetical protein